LDVDESAQPPEESDEASDAELLSRCAERDRKAWGILVARYKDLVYSAALASGLSAEDAGDVFQEVFLELDSSAARVRNPQALPRWLMVATRRLSYKVATQRRRMAPRISKDLIDPRTLVEDEVVAAEARRQLEAGLGRLDPRCAELLRYIFFSPETPSYSDICERFGLALGSVGPIRGRCLHRLRQLLEEHDD
jgi:RNA polymerase sigma factor (sigma-70 family)